MKIYNYIPALLLTGALAACQSDEALTPAYENDPNAVRITAGIAAPQTRVNTAGNGDTWDTGDRIKVVNISANAVAGKSEAVYQYNGSTWEIDGTDYMVWADGTNSFVAFYPYDESKNDSFLTFTLPNDQSGSQPTDANYIGKADWMTCRAEQSQSSTLDLEFDHKLTKVTVKIVKYKSQYHKAPKVENPALGLPSEKREAGLTLNVEDDAASITPLTTLDETDGLHTFTAILPPGKYDADADFFSLTVEGTRYTVKAGTNEELTGDGLKMGTAYEFNLTIGRDEVTLGTLTVNEWTDSDWTEHGGAAEEAVALTPDAKTHTLTLGIQGQLAALTQDACNTMLEEVIGDGDRLRIFGPMNKSDFHRLDNYFNGKVNATVNLDLSGADLPALPFTAFYVDANTKPKLNVVMLPDKCTTIGTLSVKLMSLLQLVARGVTVVKEDAFLEASVSHITLGKVTLIDTDAFRNLRTNTTIDLSECDEVPKIGNEAFSQDSSITVTLLVQSEALKTAFEGALSNKMYNGTLVVRVKE